MKQNITPEQFNELSNKGKQVLRDWWKEMGKEGDLVISPIGETKIMLANDDKELYYPLLSIGQMMEFIESGLAARAGDWSIFFGKNLAFLGTCLIDSDNDKLYGKTPDNRNGELCDGLWEFIKEELISD